jgi:outer membrane protein TolC
MLTVGRLGAAILLALGFAGVSEAQQQARVELSLSDALGRALKQSEQVRLGEAQLEVARSQVGVARSAALPQINTQLNYNRAIRSVFQGTSFEIPDSLKFEPNPNLPLEERVQYLEDKSENAALGALGGLFGDLPFGRENTWIAGLSVSQPLFSGGRIGSAIDAAHNGEEAAEALLEDTKSDVALQVKRAYYDAVLAARSAEIMETSVQLAGEHLAQVKLQKDAGRVSELEVLRAEVDLENLRPQLVQAGNARDLALLNLKRLVNLPADAVLSLSTDLDAATSAGVPVATITLPSLGEASPQLDRRASLRAAEAQISMRQEQVNIARSAFLPNISVSGNMQRQAFPAGFSLPSSDDWRDDWQIAVGVQWPLFSGFRRTAEMGAAKAQVRAAEVQRDNLRKTAQIEYERARGELERAKAQVAAASRTAAQAQRVYELTELRYREGLTTQLEVSTARLGFQQARINAVQAYHDAFTALAAAERALGLPTDQSTLP